MRTHEDYLGQRRFLHLDGLRAVAILLVFTAHLDYQEFWGFLHGGSGVTIFFVISGFIITTLLLREWDRDGRVSLKSFYIRRVFRIYPLYFIVLGLYCVMILVAGLDEARRGLFVDALPFYILGFPEIVQLWSGPGVPFSLAWSIGIEEKFYLVWPVLGFVLLARGWRGKLIALTVGFALFTLAGFTPLNKVMQPYSVIVVGCILAILLHRKETYRFVAQLGRPAVLVPVMAAVIVAQFATELILIGRPLYVPFGVLVGAMVAGVLTTSSRISIAWLASRPMLFLGLISYGFYLTHGLALNAAEMLLPNSDSMLGSIIQAAIALPVAIVGAWLLHLLVEKPLIRVGHRLAHSRTAPQTVPEDRVSPGQ